MKGATIPKGVRNLLEDIAAAAALGSRVISHKKGSFPHKAALALEQTGLVKISQHRVNRNWIDIKLI